MHACELSRPALNKLGYQLCPELFPNMVLDLRLVANEAQGLGDAWSCPFPPPLCWGPAPIVQCL